MVCGISCLITQRPETATRQHSIVTTNAMEKQPQTLKSVTTINNRLKFLAGLIINPKVYSAIGNVLSDPSKLDMSLGTLCYFALFLSAVLEKYPLIKSKVFLILRKLLSTYNAFIARLSRATKATKDFHRLETVTPAETSNLCTEWETQLMKYAPMLRSLSSYLSDVRTFHRGFSIPSCIVDILESGALLKNNDIVNFISSICISLYQPFETVAFMFDHNWLFPLTANKDSTWWYVVSTRLWFVWVAAEFLQLGHRLFISQRGRGITKDELITFTEHFATIPLCVHWSLENGCLDDLWVGLLGTLAGGLSTFDMWKGILAKIANEI